MRSVSRGLTLAITAVLVCGPMAATPAAGVPYSWTGTDSTDWFDTGNWSPAGGRPGSGDSVVVDMKPNARVGGGGSGGCDTLTVGQAPDSDGWVEVAEGSTLDIAGECRIGVQRRGNVSVHDGSQVTQTGDCYIGGFYTAAPADHVDSFLYVWSGSWQTVGSLYIAGNPTDGYTGAGYYIGAMAAGSGGVPATIEATQGITVYGEGDNDQGMLYLSDDGVVTAPEVLLLGGLIKGTGVVEGNVTSQGGQHEAAFSGPGTLTITGNFAMDSDALTFAEIKGTASSGEFSHYDIAATATLGGSLGVYFATDDFTPSDGNEWTILTASDGLGGTTFDDFWWWSDDDANFGFDVSLDYTGTSVIVRLGGQGPGPDTIPEPATLALLGLGLAAVARRRRRK